MAALKGLADTCVFGDHLEEVLLCMEFGRKQP